MPRIQGSIELNESTTQFLRGDGAWGTPTGGSGAPTDASYITVGLSASLSDERTLAGESGVVSLVDGGPGGELTISVAEFTPSTKGLTPASGGGTTNFLRADGTWASPSGGPGGVSPLVVPICASTAAAATWTNMPAAETFLFGSHRHVTKIDLTGYSQVRLVVNKQATAGAASSVLFVKYSAAFDATVGNYLPIGGSAVQVAVNAQNTVLDSGWVALDAGAKADVFVCVAGSGGDGVLDPSFGGIFLQFK